MAIQLQHDSRWGHHGTQVTVQSGRLETHPPALGLRLGTPWQRLLHWLKAPAPAEAAGAPSRLDAARNDFIEAMADIAGAEAIDLRMRLCQTRSLLSLWHLRVDLYGAVSVAHSQAEAERRMTRLNHHFPTRAPRSNWVPL